MLFAFAWWLAGLCLPLLIVCGLLWLLCLIIWWMLFALMVVVVICDLVTALGCCWNIVLISSVWFVRAVCYTCYGFAGLRFVCFAVVALQ